MKYRIGMPLLAGLMAVSASGGAATSVEPDALPNTPLRQLEELLPLLGHRNWIVIADSAYPLQSNPGIKTIVVDCKQNEVLKAVLDLIAKQPHVKPIVYKDAELKFVDEKYAPGISKFRVEMDSILKESRVQTLPHEEIIAKLDKAATLFTVVIVKTQGRLPYTSVFLELDCGYWSAEGEKALRNAMK